jgi:cysteine synthase A
VVVAVSDHATDQLFVLFNHPEGQRYLAERRRFSPELIAALAGLGLSGICNVLAAIKTARYLRLGDDEAVVTVATDSAAMYGSELLKSEQRYFPSGFDQIAAAETFGQHLLGVRTDSMLS